MFAFAGEQLPRSSSDEEEERPSNIFVPFVPYRDWQALSGPGWQNWSWQNGECLIHSPHFNAWINPLLIGAPPAPPSFTPHDFNDENPQDGDW